MDSIDDSPDCIALTREDSQGRVYNFSWIRTCSMSGIGADLVNFKGEPHICIQQGGYFDEIAIDPITLQPNDEEIIATCLREELNEQ
jgi:hypothetical protein